MDRKLGEVYGILSSLEELDDIVYNKLIINYGLELVNDTMKRIINEGKINSVIFRKYVYMNDSGVDINNNCLSAFKQYLSDVSEVDMISDESKDVLINDLLLIIKKLNELFLLVSCPTTSDNGRRLWICDRVEYCLNNCNEIELLDNIKSLYDIYVVKRNILVENNLRYVMWVAKKYYRKGSLDFEELIQYGNIGLIRAIESYNPQFEKKFIGYAKEWINQSIMANSKNVMYPIRLPMYLYEINNARLLAIDYLYNELGRMPTNIEIANYMEISVEKLEFVVNSFYEYVSLDKVIELTFDDVLIDTTMMGIVVDEDDVFESVFDICMKNELDECMNEYLDERERFILKNKYKYNMSSSEIAIIVGLTRQRVDQIYHKAITKLRGQRRVRDMQFYLR